MTSPTDQIAICKALKSLREGLIEIANERLDQHVTAKSALQHCQSQAKEMLLTVDNILFIADEDEHRKSICLLSKGNPK